MTDEPVPATDEHDDGASLAWTEALARLILERPPSDVQPQRWRRFLDDCKRFIDDGWAQRATELGWGPFDLFGCDRHRPRFARIDPRAGLLWRIDGGELIMLTDETATIQTTIGRLTWKRKPREPGQLLGWEYSPPKMRRR